jgi:hypothetical protein
VPKWEIEAINRSGKWKREVELAVEEESGSIMVEQEVEERSGSWIEKGRGNRKWKPEVEAGSEEVQVRRTRKASRNYEQTVRNNGTYGTCG